ncbi:O-antigen ligase family protein [Nostoc sp. WHI]|uniref:O-antigen ligase family protein n=1 Tax=Nostoc sp. WHI TaxID=2650611 RepID=UPI0018C773A1|nr:O-antigen ligase family protein [Nostoc sp. WHI]MBG1269807.1 O-antigen ligase family protein [Nostoc sp. WHI]
MKKFLISLEQTFTVVSLMVYSGTPLDALMTNGFTVKEGDRILFRLFFTFTYIVSLALLTLRWKKATYVLSRDNFIWSLIGICALSSFWSLDSDITTRRVIGLVGTTIFGIYLASRYTLKEQLKLCLLMLGISAVMCFVFALIMPQYGISGGESGAWRGIYPTKNVLGKRFFLSGAICLFLAITTRENRWASWLLYVTSGVLILLSKSTTSLGNFIIITAACLMYYRVLRLKYKVMIPVLTFIGTLGVAFYVWFVNAADTVLGAVGKDATLTGRTDLWPIVIEMIAKKPWLGYGYGAFWEKSSESSLIVQVVQWNAPNAHNGFLDLWLGLGLLGLLVFLIGFIVNFLRAIYLIRLDETYVNLWLLIYLTFIIFSNLTETTLVDQNSIEWILYISAVFSSKIYTSANLQKWNQQTSYIV